MRIRINTLSKNTPFVTYQEQKKIDEVNKAKKRFSIQGAPPKNLSFDKSILRINAIVEDLKKHIANQNKELKKK